MGGKKFASKRKEVGSFFDWLRGGGWYMLCRMGLDLLWRGEEGKGEREMRKGLFIERSIH